MIWLTIIACGTLLLSQTNANILKPHENSPHYISLRRVGPLSNGTLALRHICSGAMVSNRWVVTAAHCLNFKQDTSLIIVAGMNNTDDGNSYYTDKIYRHPLFNGKNPEGDIALVYARFPIRLHAFAKPIALAKYWVGSHVQASFPHWLPAENGEEGGSLSLIQTSTISNEKCKEKCNASHDFLMHEMTLCTLENVGHYRFDSGSPLISYDRLIGISTENSKFDVGHPIHFTRISTYLDWIQLITNFTISL